MAVLHDGVMTIDHRTVGARALLLAGLVVLGSCTSDDPSGPTLTTDVTASSETSPPHTTPAVSEPTASAPAADGAPQVATFEVARRETFKILLDTDELVAQARGMLDGELDQQFPIGDVVRDDPSVNAPWSWHIDPATVSFTRNAIEVCDGLPSFVEDRTVTSDQYCPWSALIVDLQPL